MDPDEVVGAKFRVYRTSAGYIRLDYPVAAGRSGAAITGQDACEVLQAIGSLANGRPTPVLVDARTVPSASREARQAFADSTVPSRVAVLIESPLTRTLANFYIAVSDPSVPTRMFTDLDDTHRWLLDDR